MSDVSEDPRGSDARVEAVEAVLEGYWPEWSGSEDLKAAAWNAVRAADGVVAGGGAAPAGEDLTAPDNVGSSRVRARRGRFVDTPSVVVPAGEAVAGVERWESGVTRRREMVVLASDFDRVCGELLTMLRESDDAGEAEARDEMFDLLAGGGAAPAGEAPPAVCCGDSATCDGCPDVVPAGEADHYRVHVGDNVPMRRRFGSRAVAEQVAAEMGGRVVAYNATGKVLPAGEAVNPYTPGCGPAECWDEGYLAAAGVAGDARATMLAAARHLRNLPGTKESDDRMMWERLEAVAARFRAGGGGEQ